MRKGDLITIALLIANIVGASLIMANLQFTNAPPDISNQTVQPILVSATPYPTIRPTSTPSPTMVLAINKDVTILNPPINVPDPIARDPGPTVAPTPTPAPTHEATIRPSGTPIPNNNIVKKYRQNHHD